jgi:hypothetical protein
MYQGMPEFRNKEEYEEWKARRLKELQEKSESLNPPPGHSGPPPADERPVDVPQIPPDTAEKGELSGIGDLFKKTWEIYKERIGTLISLYLLTALFFALALGLFLGTGLLFSGLLGGNKPVIAAGAITGALAGMIVVTWGIAATVYAVVDRDLGIKDSLVRAWERVGAFMWFFSLYGFVLTGAFLLFFIPGVIFLVWFSFGQFIFAAENEKGMNALLKSKEYVKGQWFEVFGRLFVIWGVSAVAGMVPFLGPLLSLAFAPFLTIFTFLIYRDLRTLKGEISGPSSAGERFKLIGIATLGYLVLPLIIISLMGAALTIPLMYILQSLQ